jgi:NADH-quinone oxidoreductase subunit C
MTQKELVTAVQKQFPKVIAKERYTNQAEILVGPGSISPLLAWLQTIDFKHLCNLTCIDWIEENRFDVVYNIWSYVHKIHITVKCGIHRDKPELVSILSLWPQAQVYEREIHEMFGVEFTGNPDLRPMFLHNWQDMPPLRKDFDTEAYARKAFKLKEKKSMTKKGGRA